MDPESNLKILGITLPEAPKPVGAYVAYVKAGNLVFISGQVSFGQRGPLTFSIPTKITVLQFFTVFPFTTFWHYLDLHVVIDAIE